MTSVKSSSSHRHQGRTGISTSNGSIPHSRSVQEPQIIGQYRLIKTIGKGNFAKVKLAKHVPTSRQVAVKIIDKTQLSSSSLQKLFREVRVMKSLDHPNIVKLFEVIETDRCLYLVMEYASGGEIFDYLVANGRMKERDVRCRFRQILSAVHYCHQKGIVHRDLKAENLLLDRDLNIKLADFGFSNEFRIGNKLDTFCGSPPYAAPELFQGKKYDGPEVDVWSLGVILYTLVSGSLPFDGSNLKDLRERVVKGKYRVPFYMSSDCESLLKRFLVINPSKRTTLDNAMKDRWLNLGYESDEMRPYEERQRDLDEKRIDTMVNMGYSRNQIDESLSMHRYDEIFAVYHLLGLKQIEFDSSESRSDRSGLPLVVQHSNTRWPAFETATSSAGRTTALISSRQTRTGGTPSNPGGEGKQINEPTRICRTITVASKPTSSGTELAMSREKTFDCAASMKSTDDSKRDGARSSQRTSNHPSSAHRRTLSVNSERKQPNAPIIVTPQSTPQRTPRPLSPESSRPSCGYRYSTHHKTQSPTPLTNTAFQNGHVTSGIPVATDLTSSNSYVTPIQNRNASSVRFPSRSASACSKFPRQQVARQTVHGGTVRDRQTPVATTDKTTPSSVPQRGAASFFNKLTSKFTRR